MKAVFFLKVTYARSFYGGLGDLQDLEMKRRMFVHKDLANVNIIEILNLKNFLIPKFMVKFLFKNCGVRPVGPEYPAPPTNGTNSAESENQCDIIKDAIYTHDTVFIY